MYLIFLVELSRKLKNFIFLFVKSEIEVGSSSVRNPAEWFSLAYFLYYFDLTFFFAEHI
jgi:hypothetical protein